MAAIILFLFLFVVRGEIEQEQLLRGVPSSEHEKYLAGLDDGTLKFCCDKKEIPISQINDNYCDCLDGSDEPGTGACPNKQFYCVNKGHIGAYIFPSRVNDGICDCCDGSDEFKTKACENVCEVEAKKYRQEHEMLIQQATEGARVKKEYIESGKSAAMVRQANIQSIENTIIAQKEYIEKLSNNKAQEEKIEQEEIERLEKTKFDRAAEDLGINDMDAPMLRNMIITLVHRVNATNELIKLVCEMKEEENCDEQEDANLLEDKPYIRQAAEKARTDLNDAQSKLESLERELNDLKSKASKDYGPQMEFFVFDGQCFDLNTREYHYAVCPYKDARQGTTTIGNWEGWNENYTTMRFSKGQRCWNGPDRSLQVHLECGVENKIISVDEPSVCSYVMRMKTPAVCDSRFAEKIQLEVGANGKLA